MCIWWGVAFVNISVITYQVNDVCLPRGVTPESAPCAHPPGWIHCGDLYPAALAAPADLGDISSVRVQEVPCRHLSSSSACQRS